MLTPEYLAHCADYLLGMYDELDCAIIEDISRRIVKTKGITPTAKDQVDKVQQAGMLLSDITARISNFSDLSEKEVQQMFEEAGIEGMKQDAMPLLLNGQGVEIALSPTMRNTLEAAIAKTNGDLRNLTLTTGVTATNAYNKAVNYAYMKLQSGAFSYSRVIRDAVKQAAIDGNWVSYASGHRSRLDVAIRRSVLTGINQTAAKLTELYANDLGAEYYEVTAHSGARPSHSVWQGKVYKIHGSEYGYDNFYEATKYGEGDGLCGWNCRHSFYPFWPGISKPAYSAEKLAEYNSPRFQYDGNQLTEYEVSQRMRQKEREIRDTKRVLAGYKAAIDETTDSKLKSELATYFDKISVKLKSQEASYKDLCKKTNHRPDSVRTAVVANKTKSGRIVSFDRSAAQKARYGAKRSLEKYQQYHYSKEKTIIVTDNWTGKEHPKIPATYKSYAVIDTTSQNGKQRDRTFYDGKGNMVRQISNGPHGNPKRHPYGEYGEHAHDIKWDDGKIVSRKVRELTEYERKENADIL